jgi:hypothetical protein
MCERVSTQALGIPVRHSWSGSWDEMRCCGVDRQTIGVGVGGAAVVGVAFGMARYAYGLTLPEVRSEFGLSELLLGLIASGTFAGHVCRPDEDRGHRQPWVACAGWWALRPSRSRRRPGSSQRGQC